MFEFGPNEVTGNAQCFATYEEAEQSAIARFQVWTMPTGWQVQESDKPVNYARIDGQDKRIGEQD